MTVKGLAKSDVEGSARRTFVVSFTDNSAWSLDIAAQLNQALCLEAKRELLREMHPTRMIDELGDKVTMRGVINPPEGGLTTVREIIAV